MCNRTVQGRCVPRNDCARKATTEDKFLSPRTPRRRFWLNERGPQLGSPSFKTVDTMAGRHPASLGQYLYAACISKCLGFRNTRMCLRMKCGALKPETAVRCSLRLVKRNHPGTFTRCSHACNREEYLRLQTCARHLGDKAISWISGIRVIAIEQYFAYVFLFAVGSCEDSDRPTWTTLLGHHCVTLKRKQSAGLSALHGIPKKARMVALRRGSACQKGMMEAARNTLA